MPNRSASRIKGRRGAGTRAGSSLMALPFSAESPYFFRSCPAVETSKPLGSSMSQASKGKCDRMPILPQPRLAFETQPPGRRDTLEAQRVAPAPSAEHRTDDVDQQDGTRL